jgi:hypothetical protein
MQSSSTSNIIIIISSSSSSRSSSTTVAYNATSDSILYASWYKYDGHCISLPHYTSSYINTGTSKESLHRSRQQLS